VAAESLLQRAAGVEVEDVPLPEDRRRAVSFLDIGDDTWLVDVDRFANTVKAKGIEHCIEHIGGVTHVVGFMREALRPHLVINPSTSNPICVLRNDKTCSESHPGVRVEDDAAVYADALTLASKAHRYFSNGGKPGALYALWYSTTIDGPRWKGPRASHVRQGC